MVNRKIALAIGGAVVVALLAPDVGAHVSARKTMYMTFNHPVRLPGVALGTGTYIFEVVNATGGPDIVRVVSRDRSTAYFLGITTTVGRPRSLPREQFVSLGESGSGTAPPVTVWWPDNESAGRQFIYPKTR